MAEIIQFIPRPNPNRKLSMALSDLDHIAETVIKGALANDFIVPGVFVAAEEDKDAR